LNPITHESDNSVPHCADEFEARQTRHTPQDHLQINIHVQTWIAFITWLRLNRQSAQSASSQHNGNKRSITEHPYKHDITPKTLVIIFFTWSTFRLFFGSQGRKFLEFGIIKGIEIGIGEWNAGIDIAITPNRYCG
jgi:hypothetical protein